MSFDRPDEDELYQEHILDHYEDPFHRGHCPHTTHAHEDDNPLCGDVVRIELDMGDNAAQIAEAYFNGDGCCISQASASMLVEHVIGKSIDVDAPPSDLPGPPRTLSQAEAQDAAAEAARRGNAP